MKLSTAITTAPRKVNTLGEMYESVMRLNPVIFAEPDSEVPEGANVIFNPVTYGCFKNYYHTIERLLSEYKSDYYLILEDDVEVNEMFFRELKRITGEGLKGIHSFFKHSSYYHSNGNTGWQRIDIGNKYAGTLAVLYDHKTLKTLFHDEAFLQHYNTYPYNQQRDMIVGIIAKKIAFQFTYITPLLLNTWVTESVH